MLTLGHFSQGTHRMTYEPTALTLGCVFFISSLAVCPVIVRQFYCVWPFSPNAQEQSSRAAALCRCFTRQPASLQ